MYFWGSSGCSNPLDVDLFQYPLVDRCIFGETRNEENKQRRSVSVSSGGSMYFWGHRAGPGAQPAQRVSVSSGGSMYFWGPRNMLFARAISKFQYPLVDRCIFGVPIDKPYDM